MEDQTFKPSQQVVATTAEQLLLKHASCLETISLNSDLKQIFPKFLLKINHILISYHQKRWDQFTPEQALELVCGPNAHPDCFREYAAKNLNTIPADSISLIHFAASLALVSAWEQTFDQPEDTTSQHESLTDTEMHLDDHLDKHHSQAININSHKYNHPGHSCYTR